MNTDNAKTETFIGLDLGKLRDDSALVVVERYEAVLGRDPATFAWKKETRFALRHVEQFRLGTAYSAVAARVAAISRSGAVRGRCWLVVDAGGVGAAVLELLRIAEL